MIQGIGCDICAIARMQNILQKPNASHFLRRVFAPAELAQFGIDLNEEMLGNADVADCEENTAEQIRKNNGEAQVMQVGAQQPLTEQFSTVPPKIVESLAANFAAKEAFLKATGTGLSGFALCDIAALRKKSGAPYYQFSGSAAEYMLQYGYSAHLSLTHEKGAQGVAMAYCILEQR